MARPAAGNWRQDATRDARVHEALTDAKRRLGETGLFCSVSRDLDLVVDGVAYSPPKDVLAPGRAMRWLDELVMEHFRSYLLHALRASLDGTRLNGGCDSAAAVSRWCETVRSSPA